MQIIECEVIGKPYYIDKRTVGIKVRELATNREFECHTPGYDNVKDVLREVGYWKTVKLEGDYVGEVFRILKLIELIELMKFALLFRYAKSQDNFEPHTSAATHF